MRYLILLLSLMISFQASAQVWKTQNQWSLQWEDKFSLWVRDNWHQTIFKSSDSMLYNIYADCADATYAMRALFSYLNRLPFMAHTSDGSIIRNETTQFNHHQEGAPRFRAFVKYLFGVVGTQTLALDTFPIPINRDSVRPGVVYVAPGDHSLQVVDLDEYGVIKVLSSTTRDEKYAQALSLHEGYPFFVPSSFDKHRDGYRTFRWPSEFNSPISGIERSSLEQYQMAQESAGDFIIFSQKMINKLKIQDEPLENTIYRTYRNVCHFAKDRGYLVFDTYAKKVESKITCYNQQDWYLFSTVLRDQALHDYFKSLRNLRQDPRWKTLNQEAKSKLVSVFMSNSMNQECIVRTGDVQKPQLTLYEIWQLLEKNQIVADPNASIPERWGLKRYDRQCPSFAP